MPRAVGVRVAQGPETEPYHLTLAQLMQSLFDVQWVALLRGEQTRYQEPPLTYLRMMPSNKRTPWMSKQV